jgi:hypothetical protein
MISGGFFTGVNGANIRPTGSGPLVDRQGWSIEVRNEGNASDSVTAQAICST